jgi:Fe-S cluster assembly ATP-binding protein
MENKMSSAILEIKNLHATIEDKPIINGLNLRINSGEVHALMGPNGSGKSTLSNVIMGHPAYEVTDGEIWFDGDNVLDMEVDERSRAGLFMAFQYPLAIPGVTVGKFLKRASEARLGEGEKFDSAAFLKHVRENMQFLDMDKNFINRYLNDGFSGGEKKRMEILQMLMLNPRLAIMDETDSGLDIDALKVVAKGVNRMVGPDFTALIITHYQRILDYITPQYVHILYQGRIVTGGGPELVHKLEAEGYDWVKREFAEAATV